MNRSHAISLACVLGLYLMLFCWAFGKIHAQTEPEVAPQDSEAQFLARWKQQVREWTEE